jgi:hypothetical protein
MLTRNSRLTKAIRQRQAFILRVLDFSIKLIDEVGVQISRNQGSSSNHIVREIKKFGGFTFRLDTGQTMLGGNSFEVEDEDGLALEIYWQYDRFAVNDCKVMCFREPRQDWMLKLADTMKHSRGIIKEMHKGEDAEYRALTKIEEKKAESTHLENEATRLKITL